MKTFECQGRRWVKARYRLTGRVSEQDGVLVFELQILARRILRGRGEDEFKLVQARLIGCRALGVPGLIGLVNAMCRTTSLNLKIIHVMLTILYPEAPTT